MCPVVLLLLEVTKSSRLYPRVSMELKRRNKPGWVSLGSQWDHQPLHGCFLVPGLLRTELVWEAFLLCCGSMRLLRLGYLYSTRSTHVFNIWDWGKTSFTANATKSVLSETPAEHLHEDHCKLIMLQTPPARRAQCCVSTPAHRSDRFSRGLLHRGGDEAHRESGGTVARWAALPSRPNKRWIDRIGAGAGVGWF